jgi:hypothetical protein
MPITKAGIAAEEEVRKPRKRQKHELMMKIVNYRVPTLGITILLGCTLQNGFCVSSQLPQVRVNTIRYKRAVVACNGRVNIFY